MSPGLVARVRADGIRLVLAWASQHLQALVFSGGQMFRNPLGSLLTIAVIGISLALPALFYVVLVNSEQVISGWRGGAHMTVFLEQEVAAGDAVGMLETVRAMEGVRGARYISPEEALQEFRRSSGFGEAIDQLEENPLPGVLVVEPGDQADPAFHQALLGALRALPGVAMARFDRQWVERLMAMIEILHRGVAILAVLLALGVLLIIGNTIRLSIHNRRTEIEINMLFGATDAFIQRPYLYSGWLHGLAGATLAWVLVSLATWLLKGPVGHLSSLYASDFALSGLGLADTCKLLGIGSLLGLAGSWVAVQRHLRAITPF